MRCLWPANLTCCPLCAKTCALVCPCAWNHPRRRRSERCQVCWDVVMLYSQSLVLLGLGRVEVIGSTTLDFSLIRLDVLNVTMWSFLSCFSTFWGCYNRCDLISLLPSTREKPCLVSCVRARRPLWLRSSGTALRARARPPQRGWWSRNTGPRGRLRLSVAQPLKKINWSLMFSPSKS